MCKPDKRTPFPVKNPLMKSFSHPGIDFSCRKKAALTFRPLFRMMGGKKPPLRGEAMGGSMKVLNFGSLNLDYVYAMDEFVQPGETRACLGRQIHCGGKGLN